MRLKNRNTYTATMTRYFLILACGVMVCIITAPAAWLATFSIAMGIALILASNKFTEQIIAETDYITITYQRFFIRQHIRLPLDGLELRFTREASFRSPAYFVLKIFSLEKHIYSVDSRDGFHENELKEFANHLINKKLTMASPA